MRRTRSSRTRKTTIVAKKSPVKKLLARATRSPKKVQEIEEVEVRKFHNTIDSSRNRQCA